MSLKGLIKRRMRYFAFELALIALGGALALRTAQWPEGCTTQEMDTAVPDDAWLAAAGMTQDEPVRIVCLTFDDGPSATTGEVLRILEREAVPATFFVMAADNNREYLPLIAREAEAGHQIALHTASHSYRDIYASDTAYWTDIKQLRKAICRYVPVEQINWLRFPGGSTNTVSHRYGGSDIMTTLKREAAEKGYRYVDWNVSAQDAVGGRPGPEEICRSVTEGAKDKNICVVLMHDTAATGSTARALPDIIRWFREEGYTFCTVEQMAKITGRTDGQAA